LDSLSSVVEVTSYTPIILLPLLSKILEKIILKRLTLILAVNNVIPSHQFAFRPKHGTIQQVHRIIHRINNDLENKRYCTAAFIDISQALDKVWHTVLLFKLKQALPHPECTLLRSYLTHRNFQGRHQEEYTLLYPIHAGVPQGSILCPILCTIYTADLPEAEQTLAATYADDTAILASHEDPIVATTKLQNHLHRLEHQCRICANESKTTQVTFTLRREDCSPVCLNGKPIPKNEAVKYLGLHLDRRLTWRTHIHIKMKQLELSFKRMYWIIGRKSELSLENKLLLYKTILKPLWTYGIPLWGTASQSNIEILQRFQNKILRTIVNAPRYILNSILHTDLLIPTVREEITKHCIAHKDKLLQHTNQLIPIIREEQWPKRLKRYKPTDLTHRFP
jgi:hypothetical protein